VKHIMFAVLDLAMLAVVAPAAAPQSSAVQVAATTGSATDERGVRSSVVTLAPSVSFTNGPDFSAVLGANATRFASAASQLGASGALAARTRPSGGLALAFDASTSAAHASFNATFAQADATPALNWTAGPLTLVGGMHVASGYTAVSEATAAPAQAPGPFGSPQPSQPGQTTQLVSESRSASAASYGGDLRFGTGTPVTTLLSFREEPTHVGGMLVTDRLAGATVNFGGATLSALVGHRDAPDERTDFASGSAVVPLTGGLALTMSGGKYPSNRITGAAGGQFFSMGVSIRIGGARAPSVPVPAGVGAPAPEMTRLAIRATDADSVSVAGDWDAWEQTPARRAPNGVWYVDLPLKAGEYRYAFLVDGREWRVPEGAVAVDDGFGGKAAYVTVRTAESVLAKHNQEER
jgi:hypothetical protein